MGIRGEGDPVGRPYGFGGRWWGLRGGGPVGGCPRIIYWGVGVIACWGGGAVPAGRRGGGIAVSGGGDAVGGSCRGVVRGIGRKKMPGGAGHFGVGLGRSFLGALFAGCVLFPRRDRRRAWRRRLPWHPLRASRRHRHRHLHCHPCRRRRGLRCP